MSDDKQRAMMAAHLSDELGRKARQGWRYDLIADVAWQIVHVTNERHGAAQAERDYRKGLASCGLTPEQIAAAVAAIRDGKHPDDSLAGQLLKMREGADKGRSDHAAPPLHAAQFEAVHGAVDAVLDLLGVKP